MKKMTSCRLMILALGMFFFTVQAMDEVVKETNCGLPWYELNEESIRFKALTTLLDILNEKGKQYATSYAEHIALQSVDDKVSVWACWMLIVAHLYEEYKIDQSKFEIYLERVIRSQIRLKEVVAFVRHLEHDEPCIKTVDFFIVGILQVALKKKIMPLVELVIGVLINIDAITVSGETPLCMACEEGYLQVAALLIKKGAKVNTANIWGHSPLHKASTKGFQEIVKLLITEGADVNAVDNKGWTPILRASQNKHEETESILLKKWRSNNI